MTKIRARIWFEFEAGTRDECIQQINDMLTRAAKIKGLSKSEIKQLVEVVESGKTATIKFGNIE